MNVLYKKTLKVSVLVDETKDPNEEGSGDTEIVDIGFIKVCEFWTNDEYNPEGKAYVVTFEPTHSSSVYAIYTTRDRDLAIETAYNYVPSDKIHTLSIQPNIWELAKERKSNSEIV